MRRPFLGDWALSWMGQGSRPPEVPESLRDIVDGWLILRETGRAPWECGINVGRRRFWRANRILCSVLGQADLLMTRVRLDRLKNPTAGCPLLGGG